MLQTLRQRSLDQRSIDETLEFDAAGAMQRLLSDAAEVAGSECPSIAFLALRTTLRDAFVVGDERAWCSVYACLADISKDTEGNTTPAAQRLRAFLAENDDLSGKRIMTSGVAVGS